MKWLKLMQPLQMAAQSTEAVAIQEIRDSEGNVIFTADTTGEKELDTNLTAAATEVMEGVVTNGTGRGAAIDNGQPVAGKTGTSENYRDKWFCGITPQLSVAIWMGGRNEIEMPTTVACDDVFGNFMSAVLEGQPIEQFPEGDGELEYTTTDIGQGTGSEGDEQENPAHEGESVSTPSITTDESSTNTGGNAGNTDGGANAGETGGGTGGETGGGGAGGETGGGETDGGAGGETGGGEPATRALSWASPAAISATSPADNFALFRAILQSLIAA